MPTGTRGRARVAERPQVAPPPAEIMARFGLKRGSAVVVSDKEGKPVWRVETARGPAYLKRLPNRRSRVLFAMGAAEHLHAQGAGSPYPFRTKDGELCATEGPAQYVLLSVVEGTTPTYARDMRAMAAALARFHLRSAGYVPPRGSRRRDHLDGWMSSYRRGLGVLRGGAALAAQVNRPGKRFLADAQKLHASGLAAFARLESVIDAAVQEARQSPLLCHQDFAASNLRIALGVVRAFDVDGVAFDLPVRDLRKLMTKAAKVEGRWRPEMVLQTVRAYEDVRPLSPLERSVLLAELEFPHLVVGAVKKFYLKATPEWGLEETGRRLDYAVALEGSKRAALAKIEADGGRAG